MVRDTFIHVGSSVFCMICHAEYCSSHKRCNAMPLTLKRAGSFNWGLVVWGRSLQPERISLLPQASSFRIDSMPSSLCSAVGRAQARRFFTPYGLRHAHAKRTKALAGIEAAVAARTHQRIAQGTAALRHADARYRPAAAERISATTTTHKPRAWRGSWCRSNNSIS